MELLSAELINGLGIQTNYSYNHSRLSVYYHTMYTCHTTTKPPPSSFDTVVVLPGGYVILRFISNNGGFWWYMHCHIEPHFLEGMAAVVNEGYELH